MPSYPMGNGPKLQFCNLIGLFFFGFFLSAIRLLGGKSIKDIHNQSGVIGVWSKFPPIRSVILNA